MNRPHGNADYVEIGGHWEPSSKIRHSLWSRIFVDSWIWEILGWLLSTACLAVITIIFYIYDGKPIPQWSLGITLNTLVSFVTSIAKAGLLFPVAQGVSQLKWVWFSTEGRNLEDFEAFDNASRGIWGSVQLLCTPQAWHWVSLGSIAMIVAIVLEPFTQQIISFPQRLAVSHEPTTLATVAYSTNFTTGVRIAPERNGGNLVVEPTGIMDASMTLSVWSGIFHPTDSPMDPVVPSCPTGNCTFPDYLSVAVCAKSANITDLLGKGCNATEWDTNCNLTLPNGISIRQYREYRLNFETNPSTLAFPDITHPLVNVFVLYYDTVFSTIRAAELVLEYCVKRYRTTVSNGHPQTEELATYNDYMTGLWDPQQHLNSSALVFSVPGLPVTYNVGYISQTAMQSFLGKIFWGGIGSFPRALDMGKSDLGVSNPLYNAIINTPSNQAGLQHLMDNVAMSITNNIRKRNINGAGAPLLGTAYSIEIYVSVQWGWLSLFVVLVLLVLVFLVGTMVKSRKVKAKMWKSSSLAVLQAGAGADESLRGDWAGGGMGRMGVLQSEGKDVWIKLVNETGNGEGGWRLVRE